MNKDELRISYLETTGRCNLNCPICVERYRNFDMDMDDFYAIADANEKLFCGNKLWLDFNGEPLVDPFFFERVKYLREKGAIIRISTNGLLLTEENCMKLVQSGISYLVISVSTLDPVLYQTIRGVNALDIVLKNVQRLKDCVDKEKSPMQLQAVVIDTGTTDTKHFISYFHERGFHAAVHQFTHRAQCSRKQYVVTHNDIPKRGACQGRKQNIGILCNCEVVTCCSDFRGINSLGNLRNYNYSVSDLIQASNLDLVIEEQENQIFRGACATCGDWIYYQKDSTEKYVTVYPLEESE